MKDIKNRVVFTFLILCVFCIGTNIPVAGVSSEMLTQMFSGENSGLFDLYNMFTGGSFENFTLFALGITPYITASIIIQLLTIAFPYFEDLSNEGMVGRKKIVSITRYTSIGLALIQAAGMTMGLFRKAIIDQTIFTSIVIIVTLTAGTTILMWLGEQINEFGIGNGMSLLIFTGIAMRLPMQVGNILQLMKAGTLNVVSLIVVVAATIAIIMGIIYVQGGVRKIPVQYAKRISGKRQYGGQSTHIPIKLNTSGVIPIIFSLSILQLPITISYFAPNSKYAEFVAKYISPSGSVGVWVYMCVNVALIIAFTFFYTAIVFKPKEVSDNLKNNGGTVPAIRPGKPTEDYLNNISKRLCLLDGFFLSVIASLPTLIGIFTPLNLTFGGTSLLILIGVAMDTVKQINERQIMSHYKGFLS